MVREPEAKSRCRLASIMKLHLFPPLYKLEGNGPVESAGDGALKINAGLVVGVGDKITQHTTPTGGSTN